MAAPLLEEQGSARVEQAVRHTKPSPYGLTDSSMDVLVVCPGNGNRTGCTARYASEGSVKSGSRGHPCHRSRFTEDGMSADTAPDHVRLPWVPLGTVLPGSSSVRRPRHFPHVRGALHSLDPQSRPEAAGGAKISDEVLNGSEELLLLSLGKFNEVPIEPGQLLVGRHRA